MHAVMLIVGVPFVALIVFNVYLATRVTELRKSLQRSNDSYAYLQAQCEHRKQQRDEALADLLRCNTRLEQCQRDLQEAKDNGIAEAVRLREQLNLRQQQCEETVELDWEIQFSKSLTVIVRTTPDWLRTVTGEATTTIAVLPGWDALKLAAMTELQPDRFYRLACLNRPPAPKPLPPEPQEILHRSPNIPFDVQI